MVARVYQARTHLQVKIIARLALLAIISTTNVGCALFGPVKAATNNIPGFSFGCAEGSSSGEWWSPAACHSKYYLLDPTPFENGKKVQKNNDANIQTHCASNVDICDASVLTYAGEMKSILRERMNNARITRSIGGATQVLTAAAAALLAGVGGAGAISAIAALSGTSSVIPPVSEVFGTRERAEHFAEGAKQIEDHIAAYLKKASDGPELKKASDGPESSGWPPRDQLTREGAELYEAVVATVHVVENQLVGILPDPRKLQKAVAEEFPNPEPLSLSTSTLSNLEISCTALVNVTSGGPVTRTESSDASLVTVETASEGKAVSITGVAKGKATVTVINATSGSAAVSVEVKDKSQNPCP